MLSIKSFAIFSQFSHPSVFHINKHLKIATTFAKGFPVRRNDTRKLRYYDGNYYELRSGICLPKYTNSISKVHRVKVLRVGLKINLKQNFSIYFRITRKIQIFWVQKYFSQFYYNIQSQHE